MLQIDKPIKTPLSSYLVVKKYSDLTEETCKLIFNQQTLPNKGDYIMLYGRDKQLIRWYVDGRVYYQKSSRAYCGMIWVIESPVPSMDELQQEEPGIGG